MGKRIDLTGQRFGRLTVIKKNGCKNGHILWECDCKCGNTVTVKGIHLRSGHTQSCGCYKSETVTQSHTTHGMSKEPVYSAWNSIIQRCENRNNKSFLDYGGRGIKMCERWRKSFEAFFKDVSMLPNFGKEGYSLNRIDNDGNYEPNNVEWADNIAQANNKRSNRQITYNGKTQTLAQWADEYGIRYNTLLMRLRRGWSIEKAMKTKVIEL